MPLLKEIQTVVIPNLDDLKKRVHEAAASGLAKVIAESLDSVEESIVQDIFNHETNDKEKIQTTTPLVIASLNGHLPVVEMLIKDYKVDIEQASTVKFDGHLIQEATSLWCASGAGHLEVVKILIENGANVNTTTVSNSTPLRAACFDGRLDIVEYLLGHGADLTIPNKFNNTCLMISSYKGHAKVVRCLLKNGADPDVKANCGSTSIHFAADQGHLEVIEALIDFKATIMANGEGLTPLTIAAICGHTAIVVFLLDRVSFSHQAEIQALELLGASFANDKKRYNLLKTFKYLKVAMEMKISDCSYMELQKPLAPIKAYNYHRECRNLEELESIRHDDDALHMEALIIRERILGSQNPELLHSIVYRGAVFADAGQFDRCLSLWIHALVLRKKNNRSVEKDLLRLAQVFSQIIFHRAEICFSDVETVLEIGVDSVFYGNVQISGKDFTDDEKDFHDNNMMSVIYIIVVALNIAKKDDEIMRLRRLAYRFLKCLPDFMNGSSPLHLVVDLNTVVDNFHVDKIVVFPNKSLVSLFLECGANINATDRKGNTPLHVAARHPTSISGMADVVHGIVEVLLSHGAHCDIANRDRKTPYKCSSSTVAVILRRYQCLSLRCFAARCIRDNSITYDNLILPENLKVFVDWH